MGTILTPEFYQQPVQSVARQLLGKRLVRRLEGQRISGLIVETETYDGEDDQACHAHSGKTNRNQMMYGRGGLAYVYFTYGMHWMLNCVCGPEGYPSAVLIRSILPLENLTFIESRRAGIMQPKWCDGPAKLTKALSIDGTLNGTDLCGLQSGLSIENSMTIPDNWVLTSARIGIQYAGEPWGSLPWRFFIPPEVQKNSLGI